MRLLPFCYIFLNNHQQLNWILMLKYRGDSEKLKLTDRIAKK